MTERHCSFPDCTGVMKTYKEWCPAHYAQLRTGKPLKPRRRYNPGIHTLEDLLKETTLEGGCMRFREFDDYGRLEVDGKPWRAHRLSYQLATGEDVEGIAIHHKCANTWCINPDHLQRATDYDNNLEMLARRSYEAQIAALRVRVAELEAELGKVVVVR